MKSLLFLFAFLVALHVTGRATDITLYTPYTDTNGDGVWQYPEPVDSAGRDELVLRWSPIWTGDPSTIPPSGTFQIYQKKTANAGENTLLNRAVNGANTNFTPHVERWSHSGDGSNAAAGGSKEIGAAPWFDIKVRTATATLPTGWTVQVQAEQVIHRARFVLKPHPHAKVTYTLPVPALYEPGAQVWLDYVIRIHSGQRVDKAVQYIVEIEGLGGGSFTNDPGNPPSMKVFTHQAPGEGVEPLPKKYRVKRRVLGNEFAVWASGTVTAGVPINLFDSNMMTANDPLQPGIDPDTMTDPTPDQVPEQTTTGGQTGSTTSTGGTGFYPNPTGGSSGGTGGSGTVINNEGGVINMTNEEQDIYQEVKDAIEDAGATSEPDLGDPTLPTVPSDTHPGEFADEGPDLQASAEALTAAERQAGTNLKGMMDPIADKMDLPSLSTVSSYTLYSGPFLGRSVHWQINFNTDSGGLVGVLRGLLLFACMIVWLIVTASATRGYL